MAPASTVSSTTSWRCWRGNHPQVELVAAERASEEDPEEHEGLGATGALDVAQVDDRFLGPPELPEQLCDRRLGPVVVTAHEHVVISGYRRRVDHDRTVHGVQALHDAR